MAAEPMKPDCVVVHGKVPGPKDHVLCGKHGHVLDTTKKVIIAKNLEEYKKLHQPQKMHPEPMKPDCVAVHGKVPGPKDHVLCGKHGHVLDTTKKMIIAKTVDEYKKTFK
jgi:RNase P/RNase MRP subunit p29